MKQHHPKTVLVLGAGSSAAYGYPVGSKLRQLILADSQGIAEAAGWAKRPPQEVNDFLETFRLSKAASIDAFLARRSEFTAIGKLAIARALLLCENEERLFDEGIEDNWYMYLVNRLSVEPWEEFDPSWLTVVTFNYDRSLEHFLYVTLSKMYGRLGDEIQMRLRAMKFLHVYGDLGSPWGIGNPAYGAGLAENSEFMHTLTLRSAQGLFVIPEGRDDDARLTPIQDALRSAERIAFLGFSYDATNLRRLGDLGMTGIQTNKILAGTTRGMTPAEEKRALRSICGQLTETLVRDQVQPHFKPELCESLLRHTLILD